MPLRDRILLRRAPAMEPAYNILVVHHALSVDAIRTLDQAYNINSIESLATLLDPAHSAAKYIQIVFESVARDKHDFLARLSLYRAWSDAASVHQRRQARRKRNAAPERGLLGDYFFDLHTTVIHLPTGQHCRIVEQLDSAHYLSLIHI